MTAQQYTELRRKNGVISANTQDGGDDSDKVKVEFDSKKFPMNKHITSEHFYNGFTTSDGYEVPAGLFHDPSVIAVPGQYPALVHFPPL